MLKISKKVSMYIICMFISSLILLFYIVNKYSLPNLDILLFWTILSVIAESLIVVLPSGAGLSVGFAISLATIVAEGPLAAVLVTSIGITLRIAKVKNRGFIHIFNTPIYKTIFNISQSIIVTGISGILYFYVNEQLYKEIVDFSLFTIIVVILVHTLLNTILLSILFTLIKEEKFIKNWLNNVKGVYLSAFAVGTLGVIIALAYISYGSGAVLLFFGPLLLARYSFKLYMDTKHMYIETIHALTKTIEAKDSYTSGHACRVAEYSVKLAKALNLSDRKIENIKTAALLHDIGKIGIDDEILKKPGKLTDVEYNMIKQHPVIGSDILKDVDFLDEVAKIIKYHHERYDGRGYPEGLKADKIPLEAAILSIADVYDAMTTDRPYRGALTKEKAIKEIKENSGTQFHPKLTDAFIKIIRQEISKELLENVG
ncbi:HD-GYP domain-containing protein [Caldisalinibacter kiritimatiensis]|uniref:Putative metal-dependent phosphohydrolase n=1 Tax=Caldisalinibacter kiritimatiensis TaxID=1304284 RepID=R1CBG2_9FIRM|nr:HD-GYP domain-containing protein [Caldisalinibacter kiritimatiensis]EOC99659.1 Putative metal-dependent phosphohydrolase [Caldisalinibacter kiritimatiensis]